MTGSLFDLSEKKILITGVSGMLGSSYANALLDQGATVIGLDAKKAKTITPLESSFPDRFQFFQCDVTNKKSLEHVGLAIRDQRPNCLINNAAIDSPPSAPSEENGPFESYPEKSWDRVIEVNLKGVFLCCQVFGSLMAENSDGSIVNIASIYGTVSPDQGIYDFRRQRGEVFFKPVAYSASKSGIYNLTRYLGAYWGKRSVRVNTLTLAGLYSNQEADFLEAYTKRIPIGRMANAEDYIGAIAFLCSDASRYMTGSDMVVDGGWTAI